MIERFFTITNAVKDPACQFTQCLIDYLRGQGRECIQVITEEQSALLGRLLTPGRDCVIVIGGDGTVLRAAHTILGCDVPILGINLGTRGYLAQVERENWKEMLDRLLAGDYEIEPRMMLEGRIVRQAGSGEEKKAGSIGPFYALNEAVIVRGGDLHVLNFNLYVDGLLLNNLDADGIIISTPTGSTAYNMSAGGPIVDPKAHLSVVTPICPHTLNSRSIVLSPDDTLSIELAQAHRNEQLRAGAVFDGVTSCSLGVGDRMEICRSDMVTHLVKLTKKSFLSTLHRKMSS